MSEARTSRSRLSGVTRSIIGAESATTETDRAFLSICHECERYYTELDKGLQIRVEKWIEKLCLTGFNSVWKKHRNAYAKLLLHMILNKKFQEPFHRMPPEGQLPSFPVHLRTYTVRGAYGFDDRTHGKPFWRDVYQKVHKSPISLDLDDTQKKNMTTFEDSIEDLRDSNNQILEIRRLDMVVRDHQRKLELVQEELEEEKKNREELIKGELEEEKRKLEEERRRITEARQAEEEAAKRLRIEKEMEDEHKEEAERAKEVEEAERERSRKSPKKGKKKGRKGSQKKEEEEDDEDKEEDEATEEDTSATSELGSKSEESNAAAITQLAAAIEEQQRRILRGEDVSSAMRAHRALSEALASIVGTESPPEDGDQDKNEGKGEGSDGDTFGKSHEVATSPILLALRQKAEAREASTSPTLPKGQGQGKGNKRDKECACTVEVGTSTLADEQDGRKGPFSRGRVSHAWKFLFDLSVAPSMADAMNKLEAQEGKPGDEAWPFHAAGYYEDPTLFTKEDKAAAAAAGGGGGMRVGVLEGDYPGVDQPRDTEDFMLRLNHKMFSAAEKTSATRGVRTAPLLVPSTAHPRLARPSASVAPVATRKGAPSFSAPAPASASARAHGDTLSGATGRGTHTVPVPEPRDSQGNVYEYLQRHLELEHWEYRHDTPAGAYQDQRQ